MSGRSSEVAMRAGEAYVGTATLTYLFPGERALSRVLVCLRKKPMVER